MLNPRNSPLENEAGDNHQKQNVTTPRRNLLVLINPCFIPSSLLRPLAAHRVITSPKTSAVDPAISKLSGSTIRLWKYLVESRPVALNVLFCSQTRGPDILSKNKGDVNWLVDPQKSFDDRRLRQKVVSTQRGPQQHWALGTSSKQNLASPSLPIPPLPSTMLELVLVTWVAARVRRRGHMHAPPSSPGRGHHESHGVPLNQTRHPDESDLSNRHDNPGQFSLSEANLRISELQDIATLGGGEWQSEVEVFQATVGLRWRMSSEFSAVSQAPDMLTARSAQSINQPTHPSTFPARVIDNISPSVTPTPSTLPTRLTPSPQVSPSPRQTPTLHPTGRGVELTPLPSRVTSPPSVISQLPALPAFSPFNVTLPFDSDTSPEPNSRFPPQPPITNMIYHSLVPVQSSSLASQVDLSVLLSPSPINFDLCDTFSPSNSELSDLDLGSEIFSFDDQDTMEGIDERLASVTLDSVPSMQDAPTREACDQVYSARNIGRSPNEIRSEIPLGSGVKKTGVHRFTQAKSVGDLHPTSEECAANPLRRSFLHLPI
ncbi:hypothetical protein P691DRAFT_787274 [Macrolepiota fuliginosa MF-IS2]|uniref:Uncharacterized protein n=1 Tax=Macrolepiota fuliginosa MF-IS2 TaxID=1400762 RepID=A0A9P6C041_9AGAR|nr:hypothetical protein P691DRAFT_787274 [Macrolepiota fuliginosa MF-IS2]